MENKNKSKNLEVNELNDDVLESAAGGYETVKTKYGRGIRMTIDQYNRYQDAHEGGPFGIVDLGEEYCTYVPLDDNGKNTKARIQEVSRWLDNDELMQGWELV